MNEKITLKQSAAVCGLAGLASFLWAVVIVEIIFFIAV